MPLRCIRNVRVLVRFPYAYTTTTAFCLSSGPALAGAGPMQDLGAGPSEQWFHDVIVFSQPCYTTIAERRHKALLRELSTFANVR